VGPVWRDGEQGEAELLASCYRRSLELATAEQWKSIAFPAISTGIYGFPIALAAPIAVTTVARFLEAPRSIERVVFCCFSAQDLAVYESILAAR
jgi:O-acetyl-ADP-ribose deacetylase (regulator of RNase III)